MDNQIVKEVLELTTENESLQLTDSLLEKLHPIMEQYTIATIEIQQLMLEGLQHLKSNRIHELYNVRDATIKQMQDIIDEHIQIKTPITN